MPKFISLDEALKIVMLANEDYQQRSKGRLRMWSKYVWLDMELSTMKVVKREYFKINKRTNTIDLPCDALQLSSVNVVDNCGVIWPVFRNDNVKHLDIPEVDSMKDCACEFKCGYKLCNTIKSYVACVTVKEDKMPNGDPVSFTCVDRKAVDANGFFYEQLQYPQRVYYSGVWVDTVLHTEDRKLCKVEVDQNGCVCDSEANINAVCNSCGLTDSTSGIPIGGTASCPPARNVDTWIYFCNTKLDWFSVQCGCFPAGFNRHCNNVYNIEETGNRLIFPANFGWDKVLVRYYTDIDPNNLQIPFIALDTFILGLKWWDNRFSDNMERQRLGKIFEHDYAASKWGLLGELNKYRIEEIRMIVTPPVYMPSYLRISNTYGY